jgi:hypothetical protein
VTCEDCGPMAADLKRMADCCSFWEGDAHHWRRTANDLKAHLRDRDAHIKNLEAQLRPLLQQVVAPPTEAMF